MKFKELGAVMLIEKMSYESCTIKASDFSFDLAYETGIFKNNGYLGVYKLENEKLILH